jgi:hypothetical protein
MVRWFLAKCSRLQRSISAETFKIDLHFPQRDVSAPAINHALKDETKAVVNQSPQQETISLIPREAALEQTPENKDTEQSKLHTQFICRNGKDTRPRDNIPGDIRILELQIVRK